MHERQKRSIIILGCTGSVGTTALKALEEYADHFRIVGLSAHGNVKRLSEIARHWNCHHVAITGSYENAHLPSLFAEGTHVHLGKDGLQEMIREVQADLVLNAIAGADGLAATFAAIESGKDLAFSNKESVVMAGKLLHAHAQAHGVEIIPVDSEHSTLHALLGSFGRDNVSSLVITASGGPFRDFPVENMKDITVVMAIAHPTWSMGPKISIDSATLANKGLEVMEAGFLFDFTVREIEVVIHPQSVVHSFIRMVNGALYAQLSPPDMALPIMAALAGDSYPLREVVRPLDFTDLTLTFMEPDFIKFPLLRHAFTCARLQQSYPIAYNAADEIAVQAFVDGHLTFDHIASVVEETLQSDWAIPFTNLDEILTIDREVRMKASQLANRYR